MFEGFRRDARLASLMPFVRHFCRKSSYVFDEHLGQAYEAAQAEGEEQGDFRMPGLFAVGIDLVHLAAHVQLGPRVDLYTFLIRKSCELVTTPCCLNNKARSEHPIWERSLQKGSS